ncbi:hypothetical protein BN14_02247 [Rhizoctonia solani AG-1 IB]|uniref:Uncharacterized protein n=1 Tax=Thanatephorus cucumeris (strain AG1-IB / isolate 7/3/14) TaxID=1108050 RepID=M5BLC4_THACB|nr:hypothetical protein BN14_02247 [Rhizoctonia solani AG-1 IB]
MPRIRKKTSKRGTTHQRTKIQQKVAETRKKRKKEGKKNPQWKSKHKKDPGIPNNLPFKEEILAEIEAGRRQAEEEKLRRKENKQQPRPEPAVTVESAPTVAAITADDDAPPVLIDSGLPTLGSLEKAVSERGKPIVVVLTKTDLVPREILAGWITFLQGQFVGAPIVPFRASEAFTSTSGTNKKQKAPATKSISEKSLLSALEKCKTSEKDTRVAVVGQTNSGKSSLIQSLTNSPGLPIYVPSLQQPKRATYQTTTEGAQPVQIGEYTFIDTPGFGVIQFNAQSGGKKLSSEQVETSKAKDLLTRNRGSFVHWKETDAAGKRLNAN